jgi:DNA polymerase
MVTKNQRILSLDIETFSDVDLIKCGVYRYVDNSKFEILLLAYSFDDEETKIIDIAQGEKIPDEIVAALYDESIIKTAFNANFERICLSKHFSKYLKADSWQCTAVQSSMLALPLSLQGVGEVLGLKDKKLKEGKDLIRYFCMPCKPTKANRGRIRNLPTDAPDKWEIFKIYCIRDVDVEKSIRKKLIKFPIIDKEMEYYLLDQEINDRGIKVDMDLVRQAITCDLLHKDVVTKIAYELTGLENPNSVSQLKGWLEEKEIEVDSLSKQTVKELIDETDGEVTEMLKLRQLMSKTSVKKYEAIERSICKDGRVHGLLQFYGANRSGRWAGRLIQVQNLPQNHIIDLELARSLVKKGRFEDIEMLYGNTPNILSELIRTAFIPKEGCQFIVADFSAIEARVLAWLSGEKWRLDVFASHGKIYEASASAMFRVPMEEITKGSALRQKGKVAELACIAEGELVLTDKGLVPIENITFEHKLWDGEEWVTHDGVIYKGIREVITYGGLKATEDHLVWVEGKSEPVRFTEATASSSYLIQTGNGRHPIWLGRNYKLGKEMEQKLEPLLCTNTVCKLQSNTMDKFKQSAKRKIKGMSAMLSTKTNTSMAGQKIDCCKAKVRKLKRQKLSQLWRSRYRVSIYNNFGSGTLDYRKYRECFKGIRNGSYKFKWSLRAWKYKICSKKSKPSKQANYSHTKLEAIRMAICKKCSNKNAFLRKDKRRSNKTSRNSSDRETQKLEVNTSKVRVYDIRNAGRNNRFTVSNVLVHNCGYGGGVGALKSMGAVEMGVDEIELQGLITNWRNANPNITKFWWEIDAAALKAVKERTSTVVGKIKIHYESGIMFITLPSGRKLSYIKPRIEPNKFGRDGITYEGIGTAKKWDRIETYGPKLLENIVQAASRDLLAESMLRLSNKGFNIVMHIHDEVVLEIPIGISTVKEVCDIMAIQPDWALGLPLRADGYQCSFYRKD